MRETMIDQDTAISISKGVEELIMKSGIKVVTAPLIREMVNARLIEKGLESPRRMHTRLGMPIYDVGNLILHQNKENANVPHGPEATNLTLAERIKKEYALLSVFSQDVADAHMNGDIHLHDLGFIDRPYCSGQSLEYIKKFGLNLPHSLSMAKPAKHPEVLLAHLVKFAAALQSNFAGAIGWDAINIFFAPYLEGMSDNDVKQLAQMLIFEFSQQAVARGGQAIFTDINMYWEIPKHFVDVPAIGPGGTLPARRMANTRKRPSGCLEALRGFQRRRRRRAPVLLPETARPYHRKVLQDRRAQGFPGPHFGRGVGQGEYVLRLRQGRDGQDIGVLPPELQAGRVRPFGRERAVAHALLRAPERLPQPAAPGLQGEGGRH